MLEHLTQHDCTIGELAEPHQMSFAAASKHIGILSNAGLVKRRKNGRQRICSLNPSGLIAVRDWVERYVGYWNARLDALESALKEDDND